MYDGAADDLGPIDYVVIQFPGRNADLTGPVGIELASLVDAELIRVVDLVVIVKSADGRYQVRELQDLEAADDLGPLRVLEGQLAQVLAREDLDHVVEAVDDDTTAAVLVLENTWAAPLVASARRSGGEVVASDRIPMHILIEALRVGPRPVLGRPVLCRAVGVDGAAALSHGIERRSRRGEIRRA